MPSQVTKQSMFAVPDNGVREWMGRVHHEYKFTITKLVRIKISRLELNLGQKIIRMETVDEVQQPFACSISVQ